MPYSNCIGMTPSSLHAVAAYVQNQNHEHHEEYLVTPAKMAGVADVDEFVTLALLTCQKNQSRHRRGGRPPRNVATWTIVRVPDYTDLSDSERHEYEVAVKEIMGGVGIYNWHINRLTGAADLNFLSPNFDQNGELVRDRNVNPIRELRRRMDQITDEINLVRATLRHKPILTMAEVQRKNRLDRSGFDVIVELSRLPKPPRKVEELLPALLAVGCEVPRFNLQKDSISIRKPKKKQAKRLSASWLLSEILRALASKALTLKEAATLPPPEIGSHPITANSGEMVESPIVAENIATLWEAAGNDTEVGFSDILALEELDINQPPKPKAPEDPDSPK